MDTFAQPLHRVVESMQWCLVAPEVRLLHIHTSEGLRLPVLEQLATMEHSSLNHTPFSVVEAPIDLEDDGWQIRAQELQEDWREWQQIYAAFDTPIELPDLPPLSPNPSGLASFAGVLKSALEHLPEPFRGITVILSPAWIGDPAGWARGMTALVSQPELSAIRFVTVDLEEDHLAALVGTLGSSAESVDARLDPSRAAAEAQALVASMKAAPPTAPGPRLAGLPGPRVKPPARWNAPPEPSASASTEAYRDAGLSPGLADPKSVHEIRICALEAAGAAGRGETDLAIELQGRARDAAHRIGLERETIVLEVALGCYQLQGGRGSDAEATYRQASQTAIALFHPDLAVQAQLALGAAQLLARRGPEAANTYQEAGGLAETSRQSVLAIEAYRQAGQIYAGEGLLEEAVAVWKRALLVADQADPDDRKASSAPDTAEALAALCRHHGLAEQAQSLETQAKWLRAEADPDPTSTPHVVEGAI